MEVVLTTPLSSARSSQDSSFAMSRVVSSSSATALWWRRLAGKKRIAPGSVCFVPRPMRLAVVCYARFPCGADNNLISLSNG
ncbi:hypothetical protein MRX96_022073 [Rhipicephalus microplus]